jgi:translocation and assembly module TamB
LGGLGLLAAGGLLLRFGLDPLLQRLYDHWRPRLEQIVGKAMGHPLQLGPYRGFGPTGLRVGQSRFLAGPQDRSTIVVQELRALPLPLASWRDRSLVLELDLRDAEVDLRRNAYGQVWLLGRQAPGGAPPRLELRFRLPTSARLRLWGVSPQARPLAVEGRGGAVLRLHDRSLTFQVGLATPPGRPSTVVRGQGNWQRNLWQFDLAARRQPIQGLEPLLPLAGPLRGEVEGRFSLRIDRGDPSCQGDLTLANLTWQPRGLARPLASGRLPLQCRNQSLTLLRSPWRFGTWTGQVGGHTGLDGNLRLQLQAQAPAGNPLAGRPLAGSLQGHWIRGGVQAERLEARLGPSRLLAAGRLTSRADLHGGWWLDPGDLPQARRLPPWLLRPLQGQFEATGRWTSPRLALRTVQSGLPLIGTGAVDLVWSDGLLRLRNLSSSHLLASGQMPLALVNGRGMVAGPLQSRIQLRQFPLSRLNGLVATPLQGRLDLEGSLSGSLPRLLPTLRLRLHQPGAGPLRLRETWSGALVGSADAPLLWLTAPAPGTRLQVRFDRRWRPRDLRLERGGGALALSGSAQRYRWQARAFPLQGLALALGGDRRLHSLQGLLRGQGDLGLGPVSFRGDLAIDQPSLLRVSGQSLRARLAYDQRRYQLRGRWEAAGAASLEAQVQGGAGRELLARLQARAIGPALVRQLLSARDLWLGRPLPPHGRAADLGSLAIDTLGRSLEDQLALLAESRRLAAERDLALQQAPRAERLERLQYAVDADLVLRGPDTGRLKAELVGQGHLWMASADRDRGLTGDPFQFQLRGPLSRGEGQFDLSGLPLALLSLLTPVPDGLRGNLAAHGRYRLGSGRPQLDLDLALDRAGFGSQAFALERGRVKLLGESLGLDFSLRAAGAFSSVDLAGTLPLDPSSSALELRLSSREDGLHFLSRLGGEAVAWKRGSADLQLLVRGSLRDPIANGFLRLRQGECRFIGQTLKGVEATVLFDSQQLVLQNLVARVGRQGQIRGQGKLGLVRPLPSDTGLAIDLRAVPFTVPRLSAQAEGRLILAGSLLEPRLGGDVALGRGTLDVNPAPVAPAKAGSAQVAAPPTTAATSVPELVEAKWDFRSPLVLLGPDGSPSTAASLEQAIPRVSWLQFDGLRIGFGPELRVVVANVANFSTGGSLRLSGRLDSSLRATGLVRLLGGRLNLFTTSFNLDPDAPNVAIFTPSLGLVPYLDIALRTRIADSLNVTAPSAVGGADRSTLALTELQAQGGFSSLNQLNLILVTVSVSGPADRLAQNLRLRSSPPLPKERLVALIGGNTLAGLSGGGAGTALAAVLGQSLLSPLITSLSDALGQRVSLALYPTYVSPGIDSTQERRSGRVPPQLVLGSEVGYDLTDRINASVLMAPNRSDIPPQITVNYKASEKLNLETSVDTQGAWQTQLRFFLRF